MKSILFLLFVVVLLEFTQARTRRCDDENDCDQNTECCITTTLTGRKGTCKPLSFAGDRCSNSVLSSDYGDKFVRFCPCRGDLECMESRRNADIGAKNAWRFRCRRPRTGDEPDGEKPEGEEPEGEEPNVEDIEY
ncbi:uncharacterized protein LOC129216125 [Uloborus diversus]|uniref:uncharacterized protein LOC129216125 n=1 Tax=Uloborus diversus TaxID=327109 RepID=UPI002408F4B0|nr:uncharacterized protein LOC129216125 [Uloborus diversus]